MDLLITLKKPILVLKARTHYDESFTMVLGDITITSIPFISTNWWKDVKGKEVKEMGIKIVSEDSILFHEQKQMMVVK